MSLKEKLSNISKGIEGSKKEETEKQSQQKLEPVYSKIKEINGLKKQLEIIQGSLSLKSGVLLNRKGEVTGAGMKEYRTGTKEKVKKESGNLDSLMGENKEALASMEIKTRDELIENPEFNEEPEVIAYKESLKQDEGLEISDASLKKRLVDLGLPVDEKNFSYELAEQKITKKIESLDHELLIEELKTPEGREAGIEKVAEEFSSHILDFSLRPDGFNRARSHNSDNLVRGDGYHVLDTRFDSQWRDVLKMDISNDNVSIKMNYLNGIKLIPEDTFNYIKKVYGEENARLALEKAYENKIKNCVDGAYQDKLRQDNYYGDNYNKALAEGTEKNKNNVNIISRPIKNMVQFQLKSKELRELCSLHNIYYDRDRGFDDSIKRFESETQRNKINARQFLKGIYNIKGLLPQEEELILENRAVLVPSRKTIFDEWRADLSTKEEELKKKEQEVRNYRETKPGWFGKDKWQKGLDELNNEEEEIRSKLKTGKEKNFDSLSVAPRVYLNAIDSYEEMPFSVKDNISAKKAKGMASEIFKDIEAEMMNIIDKKMPEDVIQKYKEYEVLRKKNFG